MRGGRTFRGWRYYAPVILTLSVAVAAATYGVVNAQENDYRAFVRISNVDPARGGTSASSEASHRELEDLAALVRTPTVMKAAADGIEGLDADGLRDRVQAEVEPGRSFLRISAEGDTPKRAAKTAEVVSNVFLSVRTGVARAQISRARMELAGRIRAAARRRSPVAARLRALDRTLAAREARASLGLLVVQPATAPSSRPANHPVLPALIALGACLLLGSLLVLVRERASPRLYDPRDIAGRLGLELLGQVPKNGRVRVNPRSSTDSVEHSGFGLLALRLLTPQVTSRPTISVLTGLARGHGTSTVSVNLGRALAEEGQTVRVLSLAGRGAEDIWRTFAVDHVEGQGLPAVALSIEESEVVARAERVQVDRTDVVADLRGLDCDQVLIDADPLMGSPDTQRVATAADALYVVARVGHTTDADAHDMADEVKRLAPARTGAIVLGTPARPERMPSPVEPSEPLEADASPRVVEAGAREG